MMVVVIDANVAIVANGRHPEAGNCCMQACIDALVTIQDDGIVVIDDKRRILDEYMDNLSMSGQPGLGDSFMKWLWENQAVVDRCEQVYITPKNGWNFEEFPSDSALVRFDRSDRKYVAVALTSCHKPEILNAVDTGWWTYKDALKNNGVKVKFLCPQYMTAKSKQKSSTRK